MVVWSPGSLVDVDASNPASPARLGSAQTWHPTGIALSGDRAFVSGTAPIFDSDRFGDLRLIDVADPPAPAVAGSATTMDDAWDVANVGDFAYVSANGARVEVFDATTPSSLSPLGFLVTPDRAYGISVSEERVYVAGRDAGVWVLPAVCATLTGVRGSAPSPNTALLPTPNPARGATALRFEAPSEGGVRVEIVDASGRAVREWPGFPARRGPNVADWDGLDGAGRPAASGVFFARVRGEGIAADTRIVLVR